MTRIKLLFCLSIALLSPSWAELEPTLAWKVDSPRGFGGTNLLSDPRTGKVEALLACEVDKGLVAFSPKGERLWEISLPGPLTSAPALADVTGDAQVEIVVCDGVGGIHLADSGGRLLWSSKTHSPVRAESHPAIQDLDGDGSMEILVGDVGGALHCFNSRGELRWIFTAEGEQVGPVLIEDLYDREGKEIVCSSHNGHIYTLGARGELLWDLHHPKECLPGSLPILADVESDGIPELYIGGGLNHFLRLDPRKPEMDLDMNVHLHVNSAILAADIDRDGKDEVVFGNKGGKVFCYGETGLEWTREFPRTSMSSAPLAIDLDGDPGLELLFCFHGITALDSDGNVLGEFPGPDHAGNPLAGDFDGDGNLDVLLSGYGMNASSGLSCYRWNVPRRPSQGEWIALAGKRDHSGRPEGSKTYAPLPTPGMPEVSMRAAHTPLADLQLRSGRNRLGYRIENPEGRDLTFLVEVLHPDGTVDRYANPIQGRSVQTSVSFVAGRPGTYQATARLFDLISRTSSKGTVRTCDFQGLHGDSTHLEELLEQISQRIEAWEKANPTCAAAFEKRLNALALQRKGLVAAGADKVPDPEIEMARLLSEAERLRAQAKAGAVLAATGGFAAWSACPWAFFNPTETVPGPEDGLEPIRVSLLGGEYNSQAINLTNLTGGDLSVRARVAGPMGATPAALTGHIALRRAVMVPGLRGERVADALPKLDQASILQIPPLESAQLWITLDAVGLEPGTHHAILHLETIEALPTRRSVPIEVEVLSLARPHPSPMKFCVWSADPEMPEESLQDLIAHGVNVFFGTCPKASCNAEGALVGDLDFSAHDRSVKRLAQHGILMFLSPQGHLAGQPFLSAPWKKAFVAYLRAWTARLKELGVSYDGFALYPYDEPSTPYSTHTLHLAEVAKLIREADPNIHIYTDPTCGTDERSLELLKGLIDIWCPSSDLLARFGETLVPFAKEVGKEVWFYDARGRAQTLSPLGIYHWRFWYAWNLGLTGAGWWTYGSGDDLWDGRDTIDDFYYHVYDSDGEVVTSKRWEAAREGIQDYERLFLLREEIVRAATSGASAEALSKAKALLRDAPLEMEAALHSLGDRVRLNVDAVRAEREVSERLNRVRDSLIEARLGLLKR